MKKYILFTILVSILILGISTTGFSKTSVGIFGAIEMPTSSTVWIGATIRSIGESLIGFEIAAMIENDALFAGNFTSFQIMPSVYLCIPMGNLSIYAGVAPVISILGTSINIKQDSFYARGGVQFSLGGIQIFAGASELIFIQGFTPSKKFGVEGGLGLAF
ncbi:hypothetical protein [Athalassotoga saccharophila]|uniref:hypothetical protein n=1 Tax=Athalassotoga saccharophila TaxID=1441386 RepID=UPI001379439C|nr:hypothetical protein [Athalassotoga saccharophila]BBJ27997.1 hypothetical protein ATHSA_0897 [Athalassotoga saccharophila]